MHPPKDFLQLIEVGSKLQLAFGVLGPFLRLVGGQEEPPVAASWLASGLTSHGKERSWILV